MSETKKELKPPKPPVNWPAAFRQAAFSLCQLGTVAVLVWGMVRCDAQSHEYYLKRKELEMGVER